MTESSAAKIRVAIYITGGLLCLGLVIGQIALLIAGVLLIGLGYMEYDRAKFARLAETERKGREEHV